MPPVGRGAIPPYVRFAQPGQARRRVVGTKALWKVAAS
jgi:hypothetical protein